MKNKDGHYNGVECRWATEQFNKAIYLYDNNLYNKALEILEKLLESQTDCIEEWNLHEYIGLSYSYQNKYDLAIKHLEMAKGVINVGANQLNYLIILDHLGLAYFVEGRCETAIQYYEEAEYYYHLYTIPKWSVARQLFRLNKGRCLLYLNKHDDALREYELSFKELLIHGRSKDNDYSFNTIYYEIGRTYLLKRDLPEAEKYLNNVEIDGLYDELHGDYYYYLGKLYFLKKDYKSAIKTLNDPPRMEIDKSDLAEVYLMLGVSYYWTHNDKNARRYLSMAKDHSSASEWVRNMSDEFIVDIEKRSANPL